MPARVTDRCIHSPALDRAYRFFGLLQTPHPLVVTKARLALLTISTSERRAAEIEDAYAVIVRHQGRGRRSHAAL